MKEVTDLVFLVNLKARNKNAAFLPPYFLMQMSELRISLYPALAK